MYSALEKNCHTQTNKGRDTNLIPLMWPCGSRALRLRLSLLVDNNRPYTLSVIDDGAATFHLRPPGAALTSSLTSWDGFNDTGMHLRTPGQEERSSMKGQEQMSDSRGDLRKGLDLLIN